MGNEETLGGFPVKSVVPALVKIKYRISIGGYILLNTLLKYYLLYILNYMCILSGF